MQELVEIVMLHCRNLCYRESELLANHLSHRAIRAQMQSRHAPAMRGSGTTERAFRKRLGFALTGAQQRVVAEVHQDLATPVPMYRLVQGDVGSGKTVVAALAAVRAIEAEQQTAVMAPTELLAEQHLRQFVSWFEPLGFTVLWLGGKQTARSRRSTLEALAAGRAHIAWVRMRCFRMPCVSRVWGS